MATKLYPPIIEGTIPAFYTNTDEEDGTTTTKIVVPFSLNRTVSINEIAGFALILKTVQGTIIKTMSNNSLSTGEKIIFNSTEMTVTFELSEKTVSTLQLGQFYKLQIAFVSESNSAYTVGYYSTVGIIKYTSQPDFYIANLKNITSGEINSHQYTYTLVYNQLNKDITEKLYSTQFILKNASGEIISDSGALLHNTNTDTYSYLSTESFTISQDLTFGESYYLYAKIKTSNNLELKTSKYRIAQGSLISSNIKGTLAATNNFDDGYIAVNLVGNKDENGNEYALKGHFILSKAAENDNYTWHDVYNFSVTDSTTSRELWKDFTVEQGVTYQYALQEENSNNIRSERILTNLITSDFEDAFLFDGNRQLKIRYNPKITSFKTDLQEAKSETIGNQYPFIFRNGNIYYKEFPISGLISYKMDDNEYFLTKEDIELEDETFDLLSNNIFAERNFKTAVLEWLNNGKIKLFRSPSEGNFIIRLMNVSLSPTDSLGRMLHTFNSTAYEMDSFTYDSLAAHDLLALSDLNKIVMQWATIELASNNSDLDLLLSSVRNYIYANAPIIITQEQHSRICNALPQFDSTKYFTAYGDTSWTLTADLTDEEISELESIMGTITYVTGKINSHPVYSLDIRDMLPGTLIGLQDSEDEDDKEYIQIGVTGAYSAQFESPLLGVYVETQSNDNVLLQGLQGSITYGFKNSNFASTFSLIKDFKITEVPCRQWIGTPKATKYEITDTTITPYITNNIIEIIENPKVNISKIYSMRFTARPIQQIFIDDKTITGIDRGNTTIDTAYWDMDCTVGNEVDFDNLDSYYVYAICHARYNRTYDPQPYDGYYIYANYNHGYYTDQLGNTTNVFADKYLDGCSTSSNKIIYTTSDYHNTVTIGEDTIDLTDIQTYILNNYNDVPESITFDNGVIGEIAYSTATKIYSIETDNVAVQGKRLTYEFAVSRLNLLKSYLMIESPTATEQATYTANMKLAALPSQFQTLPVTEAEYIAMEEYFIEQIKETYDDFIYSVQTTLYSYEREVEG